MNHQWCPRERRLRKAPKDLRCFSRWKMSWKHVNPSGVFPRGLSLGSTYLHQPRSWCSHDIRVFFLNFPCYFKLVMAVFYTLAFFFLTPLYHWRCEENYFSSRKDPSNVRKWYFVTKIVLTYCEQKLF